MSGKGKRIAQVPREAAGFAEHVSKADLLEALWIVCSLTNAAGSCDDDASTLAEMVRLVTDVRDCHGMRTPTLGALADRRARADAEHAAARARTNGGGS